MFNLRISSTWVARQWNTLPQHMPIQGHEYIQVKVESSCRTHFRMEWEWYTSPRSMAIQWISLEWKWSNNASLYRLSFTRHPGNYDFLNDVAFGHKELWQTLVADSLSVTPQMLWHLTTTNYGGLRPWIDSLWTFICFCLWPQWTVAAEEHE